MTDADKEIEKQTLGQARTEDMYIEVTRNHQVELVADLARKIWTDHFGPMVGNDEILELIIENVQSHKAIAEQIKEGYSYYLIQPQASPVGYFAYRVHGAEQVMFLSKLYLKSSERKKGLGKQVLNYLETICREHGATCLKLTVFNKNTSAIKIYETMGFKVIGSIARDMGHGIVINDLEMEKSV